MLLWDEAIWYYQAMLARLVFLTFVTEPTYGRPDSDIEAFVRYETNKVVIAIYLRMVPAWCTAL